MPRVVLASRSPRRAQILEQLGIEFEVRAPGVDELEDGYPAETARENARRKAVAVADGAGTDAVVLGADTVVALGGRILPKPRDEDQAREWLRALSGRRHEVLGGLCVVEHGQARQGLARTGVLFRSLAHDEVDRYVASGEWQDRAGGYAIQGRGAALVREIDGDYFNVVGLPVALLVELAPELLRVSG